MKSLKLSKLSIVLFSIFATGSVIAGNNSIGTVTVDGKDVSVVVANNQSISINGNEVSIRGEKYGLVVQEPGTKTDITGSSIAISGGLAALHFEQSKYDKYRLFRNKSIRHKRASLCS